MLDNLCTDHHFSPMKHIYFYQLQVACQFGYYPKIPCPLCQCSSGRCNNTVTFFFLLVVAGEGLIVVLDSAYYVLQGLILCQQKFYSAYMIVNNEH